MKKLSLKHMSILTSVFALTALNSCGMNDSNGSSSSPTPSGESTTAKIVYSQPQYQFVSTSNESVNQVPVPHVVGDKTSFTYSVSASDAANLASLNLTLNSDGSITVLSGKVPVLSDLVTFTVIAQGKDGVRLSTQEGIEVVAAGQCPAPATNIQTFDGAIWSNNTVTCNYTSHNTCRVKMSGEIYPCPTPVTIQYAVTNNPASNYANWDSTSATCTSSNPADCLFDPPAAK